MTDLGRPAHKGYGGTVVRSKGATSRQICRAHTWRIGSTHEHQGRAERVLNLICINPECWATKVERIDYQTAQELGHDGVNRLMREIGGTG